MRLTERLYYNDPSLLEFEATVSAVDARESRVIVSPGSLRLLPHQRRPEFRYRIARIRPSERDRAGQQTCRKTRPTGEVWHLLDECAGLAAAGERPCAGRSTPTAAATTCSSTRDSTFCRPPLKSSIRLRDRLLSHGRRHLHHRPRDGRGQCHSNWKPPNGWRMKSSPKTARSRFASPLPTKRETMGVRKIPPAVREKLRLIDIRDFDLNACGGTHVRSTGQIGAILLRKTEKVKQGVRVEFVCGLRAVSTARRDFQTLTDAAAVFSTHLWEVPQQARKSLDEIKSRAKSAAPPAGRSRRVAGREPAASGRGTSRGSGQKLVVQFFADRDLDFIKMLAQKLIRLDKAAVSVGLRGRAAFPGLRADSRPAERHGRADEGSHAEAGNARRRQSRHGAGRRARRRQRGTGPPRGRQQR